MIQWPVESLDSAHRAERALVVFWWQGVLLALWLGGREKAVVAAAAGS